MQRTKRVCAAFILGSAAVAALSAATERPGLQGAHAGERRPATVGARDTSNSLDEILDPKHTAIIVHEMINDLAARYRPEQMAAILPPIQKLLASAREKDVRVIYVRYTKHADGSTSSDPLRSNSLSGREPEDRSTIEGETGWEVIDALKPKPQDLVLRKYRPDAFYGTILDSILRWNGIKTVVIVGLGAAVGVVPTVTTAANHGYSCVAVSDGLLSTDPKRTADALTYLGEQAIVRTHADVIDVWARSPARPHGVVTQTASPSGAELASVTFEGREIPIGIEEILNPTHTAVLVYEMQNDFVSPGGACAARECRYEPERVAKIIPPVHTLLGAARARGVPILYLRRTSLPDTLVRADSRVQAPVVATAGRLPPSVAVEGTWGWEIVDALKPSRGDVIIPIYRPDAFFGTALDPLLKRSGVKTVVFVGIDADRGGLSTLMRASYLGYFRVAVSDSMLSSKPAPEPFAATYLNTVMQKTHREVADIWMRSRPHHGR
jgi:nicotinamidase-related amidase